MSSFIIQCNWTWARVYRYLVEQQKTPKVNSCQYCQISNSWIAHLIRKKYALRSDERKHEKTNKHIFVRVHKTYEKLKKKKKILSYLWSCIVGVSKLRERHCCFFCNHQQYSSPLIDCNQFYFKSTVLHTFPRTAFRSIIDDCTHRRETLGRHQLQIVLYEWIIPPKDLIRNEIKRH